MRARPTAPRKPECALGVDRRMGVAGLGGGSGFGGIMGHSVDVQLEGVCPRLLDAFRKRRPRFRGGAVE